MSAADRPLVAVRGLVKSFGALHVLRGIDLDVAAGSVTVLCGPSGSGKTTALRCLNALETPERGMVRVGDVEVDFAAPADRRGARRRAARLRARSGMVFQAHHLFPHLSVLENVSVGPELGGEVLAVMRDLASQGLTMVVVTHEMRFAQQVADQVVFLDGGVVVEHGPPAQVLGAPRNERTQRFLRRVLDPL